MFDKEKDIVNSLVTREEDFIDEYQDEPRKVAYITFDMQVEAEWVPITDSKIEQLLKESTQSQSGETAEQKKERLEGLHKELSKNTDPKFCKGVLYKIPSIHLKDNNGIVINTVKSGIRPSRIGQDTNLKDILKTQD